MFIICALNFFLCLIYIFFFSDPLWVPNHEYTDIARNIAAGNGYISSGFFHLKYAPTAFLAPFYSYFLAFFIKIFNLPQAYLGIRIFQAFINISICLMIFFVAKEVFNKKTAHLSCIIFLIYLPFIHWTTEVWDTLIFSLLVLAVIFLSLKFTNKNYFQSILLGLIMGLTMLINPSILSFLPLLFIYLFFRFRENVPKILVNLLIIFCVSGSVVMPWLIRNSLVFKAFVPVRTGLWLNLYLGNNEDATGTVFLKHKGSVPTDFNEGITLHFRPMIDDLLKMNEYEQDQFFKTKFLNYIKSDPFDFAKLIAQKTYYFLWFNPFEKNNIIWVLEYAFVLVFALYGFYEACKARKRALLFLLVFISFSIFYALTGPFFNWKYRLPIEPYFIILAGYGIYKILSNKLRII